RHIGLLHPMRWLPDRKTGERLVFVLGVVVGLEWGLEWLGFAPLAGQQGGDQTISSDPLAPGAVYVAQVGDGERVQLGRLEIARSPGTGKMRLAGSHSKSTRDSVSAAFEYLRNRASELAIDHIIGSEDYQVQIVPLLPGDSPPDLGMATILAMFSLEG
ncbi:MAG: hypothetical protein QGG89_14965, partial [Vicinamibacterales bacterium]|nr:hypothetical protein [Vicinamibacterales bacterium]